LYLGKDNKLWKSENGGASFDLVKEFGSDGGLLVKGIEISRKNPDVIYLIHESNLWKSNDAGQNWHQVNIPSTSSNTQISVSETNEDVLFLSFSSWGNNKVFVTYDGGDSWDNITTSTLDGEQINNIKVQAGTDNGVYIATSDNVYYRNNSFSDWQQFTQGLPLQRQPLKLMPFYKEGKIRYATFNRGVYESDFFESSNPIAQPMVKTKEHHCASRGIQFEDFSILNHSGASWQWSFPGATTVSSTSIRNPIVTYDNRGSYDVSLTVTDTNGVSSSKTIQDMVVIGDSYCSPEPDPQKALHCVDNYDFASNSDLDFQNVTNFTFTAWIKPDGIQNDYSGIFSLGSGEGDNKNVLNFREGNNTIGMHWNGGHWGWDSNIIVPPNQWSYVAISVSPTQIILFVNEESIVKNVATNPIDINSILIGTYYQWGGRNYKGLIDEATFWKRTLSDEEIKLARHLSKQDMSDSDMIAYYQFNHNAEAIVYDKKNSFDLSLSNNANLVSSTAPFGIGNSQLINVSTAGIKQFSEANLAIDFASGILPQGEVVVSKIDLLPNNTPSIYPIDNTYWIINNYGINQVFQPLNEIVFSQVGDIDTAVPSNIKLYKRDTNSDVQTDWVENTYASSLDDTLATIVFPGNNIQSFSQFYLGSTVDLSIDSENQEESKVIVYPNPVTKFGIIHIETQEEALYFVLYDSLGKELYKSKIDAKKTIETPKFSEGIYYYLIETSRKMYTGKLIIE